MLKKIDSKNMGTSDLGWLKSLFHFSFAEYSNPENINFGVLRVINDDLIAPNTGFDTHPHRNMEIITYVINGALTHADSIGNKSTLRRGEVQYMSAGTGIRHSEHNLSNETLRLLQIWILPDRVGYYPNYGEFRFDWDKRINNWFQIVSSNQGKADIKINQDINISVLMLEEDKSIEYLVEKNRQAYLVQIEGSSNISSKNIEAVGISLNQSDALEIIEASISIKSLSSSHFIIFEMVKPSI